MAAEPARRGPETRAEPDPGSDEPMTRGAPLRADPNPVDLDRLIHGRVRLGIVSALAVHEVLSFPELKELLDTSDGNLSVHARRLEEAGYVSCDKSFEGRVPRTEYRLTAEGRKALGRYLDHMEALIGRVREP
jgi:DNA-binding transcriptional ArsR family regulator